ncbi:M81 family metallopeptidase [Candidatus Bathyarchaeota archaeon]|nr:M81 family metallopeptidase [Candidatus Bathyarchaeota archaeon]MBL7079003.1 M81 family metallopeptidase [Candidatus Bathyarchaeota archaeon]
MRIVTGTISHETNVLSNIATDLEQFRKRRLLYGEEVFDYHRGTKTPVGGLMDGCAMHGFELVPTVFASATPSGTITAEAFDTLLGQILEGIEDAGVIDGVAMHLHGAGVAENHDDIEGRVLAEVRRVIGDKPLVSTFDLHANHTRLMVESADVLIGYDTYPHVDGYERGVEAIDVIARLLDGSLVPTKAFRQPPMMPALQAQFTGKYPMSRLIEEAHRMEGMEAVETVTVAAGFPWSDFEDVGLSFIVTTNDDQALADRLADELQDLAWGMRRDFLVKPVPVRDALRRVKKATGGPYILADIGDNPGGGAPEDGTVVLRAILEEGLEGGVLAVMWDPEAVEKASTSGIGTQVTVELGGKTDDLHGKPLEVTGTVKTVTDGKWIVKGPMGTGSESDMGETVVLLVGGNEVIVTSKRLQPMDLELYRSLGIEPTERRFIVVKSSVHYRAAHMPIAVEVIELDTPGLTSPRLAGFGFKKLRRPIFPLDVEMLGITELKSMDE